MDYIENIGVDLRHALLMVARALDYVGIDDINHGHRVAYMAYECAKQLEWPEEKAVFAYYTGLIHDCGVSSTDEHAKLVGKLEPEDVRAHCLRGYEELKKCPLIEKYAIPVLYHHTQWLDLKNLNLSPFDKDIAAIVYLADRVDFLRAYYVHDHHQEAVTLHKELISEALQEQAGILFNPEMVSAMIKLVYMDGFWYKMEPAYIEMQAMSHKGESGYQHKLTIEDVTQLARFVARIVDAKSTFTYQHSEKVALLSRMLAKDLGLSTHEQDLIFVAGLTHDIGKLRTPDEILNKGAKLDRVEYTRIRRHTVDTEYTLRSFFPNSKIGVWASNHHERLDGSGYPYQKRAEALDLPSRIIAVADIFQALSQKRPYRDQRLPISEILQRISPLAEEGKIDKSVYKVIENDAQRYYQASIIED